MSCFIWLRRCSGCEHMEEILKVAAVAVTAVLCAMVLQRHTAEFGLVLALAAGVLILGYSMGALGAVCTLMDTLADTAGMAPGVFKPMIKTVGIGVVTRITAELCRDAKASGIAAFVETAGAAMALFAALPLLSAVLQTVSGLLQ